MIEKKHVYTHFNRHAHEYDQYAHVQLQMVHSLIGKMKENRLSADRRNILEIGCGTGRLTEQLAIQFPQAHIVALDLSERMIEQAKTRLSALPTQVTWVQADAEAWVQQSQTTFDLIISNATFQWFTDTAITIKRLLSLLNEQAVLAFATFLPGTFVELEQSFAEAAQQLGLANGKHGQTFVSWSEWQQYAEQNGAQLSGQFETVSTVYPTVLDFLHQIKRVGAGNALRSDARGSFVGKTWLLKMMEQYEYMFKTNDGVLATYEIAYGIMSNKR